VPSQAFAGIKTIQEFHAENQAIQRELGKESAAPAPLIPPSYTKKKANFFLWLASLGALASVGTGIQRWSAPAAPPAPVQEVTPSTDAPNHAYTQALAPGWQQFNGSLQENQFYQGSEMLLTSINHLIKNDPALKNVTAQLDQLPWPPPRHLSQEYTVFLTEQLGQRNVNPDKARYSDYAEIPVLEGFVAKHKAFQYLNVGEKKGLVEALEQIPRYHNAVPNSGNYEAPFRRVLARSNGFDNQNSFDNHWTEEDAQRIFTTFIENSDVVKTWEPATRAAYQKLGSEAIAKAFTGNLSRPASGLVLAISQIAFIIRRKDPSAYSMDDESHKIFGAVLTSPLKLLKRVNNPHFALTLPTGQDLQVTLGHLQQASQKAEAIATLIQQAASRYPELEEHFKGIQSGFSASLPNARDILRHYMVKLQQEALDQKRPVSSQLKGVSEINEKNLAEALSRMVQSAYDSGNFLPLLLPKENETISRLKTKKRLSIDEAKLLNQHELRQAGIILVSQTMGYVLAKAAYENELKKKSQLETQLAEQAKQTGPESDLQLVETHRRLQGQSDVVALSQQKFSVALELQNRAKLYLNRVTDKKIRLDAAINQGAIQDALGHLDGAIQAVQNYRMEDIRDLIAEIQFKNTKEAVATELAAAEIRATLVQNADLPPAAPGQ
jgi:hypothetical protein